MQIIDWPDFLREDHDSGGIKIQSSAMTIGVFDGLHLGHQALIKKVVETGPNPTVVSFRENPKKLISPKTYQGDIFSLNQKIRFLESMGVRRLVLIDFSGDFSKLNGWDFLNLLADRGKLTFLAIGDDFCCGFQRNTNAEQIAEINKGRGIPTVVIPPVELTVATVVATVAATPAAVAGESLSLLRVDSSRIRSAILSGDIKTAAALLGRNFELDLSDLQSLACESVEQVFDLRSSGRIIPADGQYPVLINPGGMKAMAIIQNEKLKLVLAPGIASALKPGLRAESLEFI